MEPEFTASVEATSETASRTEEVTTGPTSAAGSIRLVHGTDLETALWIAKHGLSHERMMEFCARFQIGAGRFWTSTSMRIVRNYAEMNPEVYLNGATPAIVGFSLPVTLVTGLLGSDPPLAEYEPFDEAYCFDPRSFNTVNSAMTGQTVTPVAELKFEE